MCQIMKAVLPKKGLFSLYHTRKRISVVWNFHFLCAKERLEFRANDKRCHQIYYQVRPFSPRILDFKEKVNASNMHSLDIWVWSDWPWKKWAKLKYRLGDPYLGLRILCHVSACHLILEPLQTQPSKYSSWPWRNSKWLWKYKLKQSTKLVARI